MVLSVAAQLVLIDLVIALARQFAGQPHLHHGVFRTERAQLFEYTSGGGLCGRSRLGLFVGIVWPEVGCGYDEAAQLHAIDGDVPAPAQSVRGDAQEDKAGVAIGVVEGDMLRCPGYNDFGAVESKAGEGMVIAGEDIAKGGLGGDAGAADLRLGIERRSVDRRGEGLPGRICRPVPLGYRA